MPVTHLLVPRFFAHRAWPMLFLLLFACGGAGPAGGKGDAADAPDGAAPAAEDRVKPGEVDRLETAAQSLRSELSSQGTAVYEKNAQGFHVRIESSRPGGEPAALIKFSRYLTDFQRKPTSTQPADAPFLTLPEERVFAFLRASEGADPRVIIPAVWRAFAPGEPSWDVDAAIAGAKATPNKAFQPEVKGYFVEVQYSPSSDTWSAEIRTLMTTSSDPATP